MKVFKEVSGVYHLMSASKQQDFGMEVFFETLFNI